MGELLVLLGAFKSNTWIAALIATGLILGAAYMLFLYRRIIFGLLQKDELKGILDLNKREILVFAPLILVVFWMGVYPSSFLEPMEISITKLLADYDYALASYGQFCQMVMLHFARGAIND